MKLQQLIDQTELDMTADQVKAFFLGVLTADKPLPFPKAVKELVSETPDEQKILEPELKILWDQLSKNKKKELGSMFPDNADIHEFLEHTKDQLDYFLTALTLSGTTSESAKDEDFGGMIEELEELILELDEFLADKQVPAEAGQEIKEIVLSVWSDLIEHQQ